VQKLGEGVRDQVLVTRIVEPLGQPLDDPQPLNSGVLRAGDALILPHFGRRTDLNLMGSYE